MNLKEAIAILKEGEISEALQVVLDHVEKPNIKELERRISKETDLTKKLDLEEKLKLRIEEIDLENQLEKSMKDRIKELDFLIEEYSEKINNITPKHKTILVVGSHDQIPSTIGNRLKEIPLPHIEFEVMETKYQKPENKQFYKDIAK